MDSGPHRSDGLLGELARLCPSVPAATRTEATAAPSLTGYQSRLPGTSAGSSKIYVCVGTEPEAPCGDSGEDLLGNLFG
jgi:hypothetical protein